MGRCLEITQECPLILGLKKKKWPMFFLWPFQNQLYFPWLRVHFVHINHSNVQHIWITIQVLLA